MDVVVACVLLKREEVDGKRPLGDGRCSGVCSVEKGGGLEEGGQIVDPERRDADLFLGCLGSHFVIVFFMCL